VEMVFHLVSRQINFRFTNSGSSWASDRSQNNLHLSIGHELEAIARIKLGRGSCLPMPSIPTTISKERSTQTPLKLQEQRPTVANNAPFCR